jgi:hypothetical protein
LILYEMLVYRFSLEVVWHDRHGGLVSVIADRTGHSCTSTFSIDVASAGSAKPGKGGLHADRRRLLALKRHSKLGGATDWTKRRSPVSLRR